MLNHNKNNNQIKSKNCYLKLLKIKNRKIKIFPPKKTNLKSYTKKIMVDKKILNLNDIMLNTITSVLMVGGFISLSFTLLEILNFLQIFNVIGSLFGLIGPLYRGIAPQILKGFLELTSGCLGLSTLNLNPKLLCVLLTTITTFGGLSIHFQSNIFLSKCKIKYGFFLLTKTTQTILSIFICLAISLIFL